MLSGNQSVRFCYLMQKGGNAKILLLFRPPFVVNIIYIPDNQLYCVFLQALYFRPYLVLLLKNILYFCAQNVIILKYEKKYFIYDIVFCDAFGVGIMLSKS